MYSTKLTTVHTWRPAGGSAYTGLFIYIHRHTVTSPEGGISAGGKVDPATTLKTRVPSGAQLITSSLPGQGRRGAGRGGGIRRGKIIT